MTRALGLGLAVAVNLFSAAAAQTAEQPTASLSGRAQGDALIAATGMPQLFLNETVEGKAVTIRHRPSGLLCLFNPRGRNALQLPPTPIARGDDVLCSIPRAADHATLYATRHPHPLSLGDELLTSLRPVRARYPRLKPYRAKPSKMMEQLAKEVPRSLTSRLVGEGVFTRLSVAQVGPWTFKMRVTGDADAADFIDQQAEMTWFMTLYTAQEHQAGSSRRSQ